MAPAPLPEDPPYRLIRYLSRADVVLGPFVGRGTTMTVAHRLGRRAIGLDLVPVFLEMGRLRLLHP